MNENGKYFGCPAISVILPVYNAQEYLPECIESILSQTLDNIEVICVNDGSTDGSADLLRGYAARDGRIRCFTQDNVGAARARNRALDEACGEFVSFMDADDYYPSSEALSLLYRAAKTAGVRIAGGSMCIDRGGVIDFESLHGIECDSFGRQGVVAYRDYQYNYDYTRYIYSLKLLNDGGIRFPQYSLFEDPPFFVNAMLAAESFYAIPAPVYCYRYSYHDSSQWSIRQICDRIHGIVDCLEVSKRLGYSILHHHAAVELGLEAREAYESHFDADEVLDAYLRAILLVDTALIRQEFPDFPKHYFGEPIVALLAERKKLSEVQQSLSFRVGRAITFLPRRGYHLICRARTRH